MSKSVVTATTAARAKALTRKANRGKEENQKRNQGEVVVPQHANDDAQALAAQESTSMVADGGTLAGDFSFSGVMADAAASASMMDVSAESFGAGLSTFAQDADDSSGGGMFGSESTPILIGAVIAAGLGVAAAVSGGDDDDDNDGPDEPPPAANKAPTITAPATVEIDEDATATGKITATDPDGDTLTFTVKGTAPEGFVLNKDGTYTIDTNGASYQSLTEGETKDFTVDFTVSDGKGGTTDGKLTFKVTGADEGPATATIAVSGNGSNTDADDVDTTYNVAPGNYTYTITGFDAGTGEGGDRIVGPAGAARSFRNADITDGEVEFSYVSGGSVATIVIDGLTAEQDAAIRGAISFNDVFGTGAIA